MIYMMTHPAQMIFTLSSMNVRYSVKLDIVDFGHFINK